MRAARALLQALRELVPESPPIVDDDTNEPQGKRHHALTVDDDGGALLVHIQHDAKGQHFWVFKLDGADLDRDPHEVATDVVRLLEEATR